MSRGPGGPRLLFRFFRTVAVPNLGRVGADLRAMEEELAASGLDWYAVPDVRRPGCLAGLSAAGDGAAQAGAGFSWLPRW